MDSVDVIIIGGGIVGLATGAAVLEHRPRSTVLVLEKETQVGTHQTGRNSGVIHSGLYYEPGSQKAKFCVAGARQMHEFCGRHGIEIRRTGKVVVASDRGQLDALSDLEARASANGIETERIGPLGLAEHEPHASGVAALWVPGTSIVSFGQVAAALAGQVESEGGRVLVGSKVTEIFRRGTVTVVSTEAGLEVSARRIVNAAGLQVDRIAEMAGHYPAVRIVPFRGEYRSLLPEARSLVRGLIYPVPDSNLPFLGVHFTKMIHGGLEVGPNAVLSLSREGYLRSSFRPADAADTLRQAGFWRLARQNWRAGFGEQRRSLAVGAFVADARRLVPALEPHHLGEYRAGVRAQAVDSKGTLVQDFVIEDHNGIVHVLNAPSPGATSSLAIGWHVASLAIAGL